MNNRQMLVAVACVALALLLLVVLGHEYRAEAVAFIRAVKHAL